MSKQDVKDQCPCCKSKLGVYTSNQDGQEIEPPVGDITVCLYCQSILYFKGDGITSSITKEMEKDLKSDKDFWSEIQRIRYIAKESYGDCLHPDFEHTEI